MGEREAGREGGWEGGREGGSLLSLSERWRLCKGGTGREGGREAGRQGGREGGRGKDGGADTLPSKLLH